MLANARTAVASTTSAPESIASVPIAVAQRIAAAGCSLLLTGETGSGKGHLARWMHLHGPRAGGPFVPVNCGAIPDGLVDSHLFGHERGAFTGAEREHSGLVRAADGGTLFLDEIGELPPPAQCRLLRLLEEREVQPVGSTRPQIVDLRVIAATSADLEAAARRGDFRLDLYYRLDVIHLELAPLRRRRGEIGPLFDDFNREFAERLGRPPLRLSQAARQALQANAWPGNVRELRAVAERLHVLRPRPRVGVSELRDLGGLQPPAESHAAKGRGLRDVQREAVQRAVEVAGGNISRAAVALGVHRSTVHRWLASA